MFADLNAAREETRKILPTALEAMEKVHWRYRPVQSIVVSDAVMDCLYRPRLTDRILLELTRLCFAEEPLSREERAIISEAMAGHDDPCGHLRQMVHTLPLPERTQERLRYCLDEHGQILWSLCTQLRLVALGLYFRPNLRQLNCLGVQRSDDTLPVLYEKQGLVAIAPFRIAAAMRQSTSCTDVRAALIAVLLHEHSHAVRDRTEFAPADEHMAQLEAVEASTYLPDGRVRIEQVQRFIWDLSQQQPAEYGTFRAPTVALGLKRF